MSATFQCEERNRNLHPIVFRCLIRDALHRRCMPGTAANRDGTHASVRRMTRVRVRGCLSGGQVCSRRSPSFRLTTSTKRDVHSKRQLQKTSAEKTHRANVIKKSASFSVVLTFARRCSNRLFSPMAETYIPATFPRQSLIQCSLQPDNLTLSGNTAAEKDTEIKLQEYV